MRLMTTVIPQALLLLAAAADARDAPRSEAYERPGKYVDGEAVGKNGG